MRFGEQGVEAGGEIERSVEAVELDVGAVLVKMPPAKGVVQGGRDRSFIPAGAVAVAVAGGEFALGLGHDMKLRAATCACCWGVAPEVLSHRAGSATSMIQPVRTAAS